MLKKRMLSLMAMVGLVLTVFAGCTGQGKEGEVVMNVNGEDIYMDEYVYHLSYIKYYFDSMYGTSLWEDEASRSYFEQYAEEYAQNQVKTRKCIDELCNEYNIVITDEEKEQLQKEKKEDMQNSGGIVNWTVSLKQSGCTEAVYDLLSETSLKYDKLYDYLYGENGTEKLSEEDLRKEYEEKYITSAHILFSSEDEEGNALGEEELKAKKELAEKTLERVKNGEDFIELSKELSEDPGVATNPNGYTFTEGEMINEFYNTSKSLEVNAVSEIVETEFGYHIIKRLPLDSEYFNEVSTSMQEEKFYDKLEKKMEGFTVNINAVADTIDITNLISYI